LNNNCTSRKQNKIHVIFGTMKQKEYIGPGSISNLKEVLREWNSKKIFLVTDKQSYSACGAKDCMHDLLKNYEVHQFCEFTVNPKIEDIIRGISKLADVDYDTVIAVGGGSTIDTAKAVNFLRAHPSALKTLGHDSKDIGTPIAAKPLIAIPTTAGSGSQATHFCVIYIDRQKHSLAHESILPKVAIVDADLTMSLPETTTAVSALDALSQAIESYWSINSTDISKQFSTSSIDLIVKNIPEGVTNPTISTRLDLAKAAHLAGKAINITKTTAPHSISYFLTAYFGIPHGQAVGVTLPSLLVFNANTDKEDVVDKRGAEYVRNNISELCRFLGTGSADEAAGRITQLIRKIGLETRLAKLGLSKKDIEPMVASSFSSNRMKNNPRLLTKKKLRNLLEQIY
jgi:alcohol dehydrogenase class IV